MAINEAVQPVAGGRGPEWARKYPPLIALIIGLIIMLAVLPSALNLPQSNPQETVEYAPVPPKDENNNDASNSDQLGLAGSASIGGAGAPGGSGPGGPPPLTPTTRGQRDPRVQCYGKPPRQTEDPLSPPCVGYFAGDNHGATYQGVTKESVRILVFLEGGVSYTGASDPSNRVTPTDGRCIDLSKPASQPANKGAPEHLTTSGLRVYQAYFNNRFQTYGRRVWFTVCYSTEATPEVRRQDAVKNLASVQPFASVVEVFGAEDDYLRELARKGVLNFGSFALRPNSYFNSFPKSIWSYLPSVEQQVDRYTTYICTKVVKPGVSDIAGPELNGKPRKYGLIRTTDPDQAGATLMADLVKQRVKECGANFAVNDATFDTCCYGFNTTENSSYADLQMSQFRNAGVTTILWPGGINGNYGRAANAIGYFPEWIVLGDGSMDAYGFPRFRGNYTDVWDRHAIVISPQPYQPAFRQQQCYQAFRSVDASTPDSDVGYVCDYYKNLFQLFVGIQVAGPRLGPTSIDQGFHAIPQKYESTDPTVPSCFYLPGDYTCIKDAEAMLWSAASAPPGQTQASGASGQYTSGCWLALEGGKRYAPGTWPEGNISSMIKGGEVCNGYTAAFLYRGP